MTNRLFRFLLLVAAVAATPAGAADMRLFGTSPFGANTGGLISLYDNHPTHTGASIASLTAGNLAGVELLWLIQPSAPYSAPQLNVLQGYIGGGGRIAFLGEHGTIAPTQNNNITAALAALGAHIAIQNIVLDSGFRTANRTGAGDGGTILTHPLTTGVDEYRYAAFAPLTLGTGAQALMLGDDDIAVMMAFENVGPGSVFLITDQNVLDDSAALNNPAFDNNTMFLNLLTGVTGAPPPPPPPGSSVPEPGSLVLLGVALGALGLSRRRRKG